METKFGGVNLKTSEVAVIKEGDVFISRHGTKYRPYVVLKVGKKAVLACSLSTTKDIMYVCDVKSRFPWGYIGATVGLHKKDFVKSHIVGVLDNPEEIPQIISKLKQKLTL